MFYTRWVSASLLVILISHMLVIPAYGEVDILPKGQESPYDGLLLDKDASIAVTEKLRDLKANEAIIETLKAEILFYKEQIQNLETSNAAYKQAIENEYEARIRADERDKLREEVHKEMVAVIKLNQLAIENYKASAEFNLKALQSAQAHIEKAEKYKVWAAILGSLSFLLLFFGKPF